MIIIRGMNTITGEVFEITSRNHRSLSIGANDTELLVQGAMIFGEMFEGTDHTIDRIEVIAE